MGDERVRAARGAIRVAEDTVEHVFASTERLLSEMFRRNGVERDDLVSVFFTATADLRSAFPAEAARRMGLGAIPLMCAQEMAVRGSMSRVVRILMHFHSVRGPDEIVPTYLDGAESLRDDLD
jgi:chorismate mutase